MWGVVGMGEWILRFQEFQLSRRIGRKASSPWPSPPPAEEREGTLWFCFPGVVPQGRGGGTTLGYYDESFQDSGAWDGSVISEMRPLRAALLTLVRRVQR